MLCITLSLSACSGNPEEKAASHLKKGEEYMESSQYSEAAIEFMNVVKLSPESAEGYYKLGLAHLRIGGKTNMQLAYREFIKAADLDPSLLDAQIKIGEFYLLA
ncbi:MAG: tetratricopeptide repeat protein, partial [Deltaproteobacteria bacterium]|nr:tetratricopeptide repeat protein [Deltaproteobacteria bacterium]